MPNNNVQANVAGIYLVFRSHLGIMFIYFDKVNCYYKNNPQNITVFLYAIGDEEQYGRTFISE